MSFTNRAANERLVGSVSFPRWVTIPFIMIIGLILWVGVLADSPEPLTAPGVGSIVYVAAVIVVAALLAYADRKPGKDRRNGQLSGPPSGRHCQAEEPDWRTRDRRLGSARC